MGVDWILDVPEGKEGVWMDYWHQISRESVKGTGTGLLARSDLSIRGDWAGLPTTERFLEEYNSFLEDYPTSEAIRRLKLQHVSTRNELEALARKVLPTVSQEVKRKERLEPLGKTELNFVHHTKQGAIWDELRTIFLRFFFARFAEDSGYKIIKWT